MLSISRNPSGFQALANICRQTALVCSSWRLASLTPVKRRYFSDFRVEVENNFAVMFMGRKPVNSYIKKFIRDMTSAVKELESDTSVNGLIITSEVPNIFSGGLELSELYQKTFGEVVELMESLYAYCQTIYGSRLAVFAAINGHALAGGCVTALLCDHRVMSKGRHRIGLIEAQREVLVPVWLADLLTNTIGTREAERAIQLGLAYCAEDAFRVGLVDELVDDERNILERCREEMTQWLSVSNKARAEAKLMLRRRILRDLRENGRESILGAARGFVSEEFQKNIERFMKNK